MAAITRYNGTQAFVHGPRRRFARGAALLLALAITRSALGQGTADNVSLVPGSPPAAPQAEAGATTGFVRIDTDRLGTQLSAGATHTIASLAIASGIYVIDASGQLDLGLSFTFGDLTISPMVGVAFDFGAGEVAALVAPQLYFVLDTDWIDAESWNLLYWSSPFRDGVQDVFYTRNFVFFELDDELAIGGHIELSVGIDEDPGVYESGVLSLPVGGVVRVGYGKGSTLLVFLGYELEPAEGAGSLAGRFTFIHSW